MTSISGEGGEKKKKKNPKNLCAECLDCCWMCTQHCRHTHHMQTGLSNSCPAFSCTSSEPPPPIHMHVTRCFTCAWTKVDPFWCSTFYRPHIIDTIRDLWAAQHKKSTRFFFFFYFSQNVSYTIITGSITLVLFFAINLTRKRKKKEKRSKRQPRWALSEMNSSIFKEVASYFIH